MTTHSAEPRWTEEESIACECACEAISDMLTIQKTLLSREMENQEPDLSVVENFKNRISELEDERYNLRVKDADKIAKIRREYGAIIRECYAKT